MTSDLRGIFNSDLLSKDYHGMTGSFSSSQLKDILDDPERFYFKHILKSIPREELTVFEVGTYFHTAILEPGKLKIECAVYTGTRRGKEWEAFKVANAGKAIITDSELKQADALVSAVRNSPIAMKKIESGEAEVSAFIEVLVTTSGDVLCNELVLGKYGWEKPQGEIDTEGATKIVLKARADLLGDGFILDLKSTTGNAKSPELMRKRIVDYQYHVSAALYLDVFSAADTKTYCEFLWTFASKDFANSRTYKASLNSIAIGRAKWKKAVVTLATCIKNNWVFQDEMGVLDAPVWEKEWLQEKSEDLL